jgi:hypothetical protein
VFEIRLTAAADLPPHRASRKLGAWHDVGYWQLELAPPGPPPAGITPVAAVWGDDRSELGARGR